MNEVCLNPKWVSERSAPAVKPKFPRLAWKKKKEDSNIKFNSEFVITHVGGFHEKK